MSTAIDLNESIKQHYGRLDLGTPILGALEQAGKDLDKLTLEDLAPVDEFHIRRREATFELARAAGISAGTTVLDVGSGLGGACRHLAREFGCRVTGIDLTDEYCRVAALLTQRVGIALGLGVGRVEPLAALALVALAAEPRLTSLHLMLSLLTMWTFHHAAQFTPSAPSSPLPVPITH